MHTTLRIFQHERRRNLRHVVRQFLEFMYDFGKSIDIDLLKYIQYKQILTCAS